MEIVVNTRHGHKICFRECTQDAVEVKIVMANGQPATPQPFFVDAADLEHGVGGLCKAMRAKNK